MAWTAFEHMRASGFADPANLTVLGLDREVAAALVCGLAAIGLLVARVRAFVALTIVFGIAYMLSSRRLAGTLGYDALTYAPVVAAALFVCWPRLVRAKQA